MAKHVLYGLSVSPFVRAARIALLEKQLEFDAVEVGLDGLNTAEFRALNPFGKIPVLTVDGISIYETPAILVYADSAGSGPALQPSEPLARARNWSLVGVAQNYLYPAAVMQLYFHTVLAPLFGLPVDASARDAAVEPLGRQLDVLEAALTDGVLGTKTLSHADLMCGVMVDYAARTRAGRSLLGSRPQTLAWIASLRARRSFIDSLASMLAGTDEP